MRSLLLTLFLSLLVLPATAQQDTTRVLVRAIAQDAKVIHDGVGGARITIVERESGELLAEGIQRGSSGDTERIMRGERARGRVGFDSTAAHFIAELVLDGPTEVEITAAAPLAHPDNMQRTTTTTLLLPGKDVLGDGVVLELYGLIVDAEQPASRMMRAGVDSIDVRTSVQMLCGCPITEGGLWEADSMEVEAQLVYDGAVVQEVPLTYAGEPNTFAGRVPVPGEGTFELQVIAADAEQANFGRFRSRPFEITFQPIETR